MPLQLLEPRPPFARAGVEDPKPVTGTGAQHALQVVGRPRVERQHGPVRIGWSRCSRVSRIASGRRLYRYYRGR